MDVFKCVVGTLCVLWLCMALLILFLGDELVEDAPKYYDNDNVIDDDVNNKHT